MADADATSPQREKTGPGPGAAGGRVKVLLPLPLGDPYDYKAPADLSLAPGDVVRVPLGNRESLGVVWDESGRSPGESGAESGAESESAPALPEARLKSVIARFDVPPLPAVQRRFVERLARYTLSHPGAVLRMVLSVPEALEAPKAVTVYQLAEGEGSPDLAALGLRATPARARVLEAAGEGFALPAAELARMAGVGTSVVKGLAEAGVLEGHAVFERAPVDPPDPERAGAVLSEAQQSAADALCETVRAGGFSVTLLDGVTGAGKTETYLEAVAETLRQGRQVLVLLPEIALSPQWLERFKDRFGASPAPWHSDLTRRQRRRVWRGVSEGQVRVVVGARSALFLPFPDLGLIVVDEEHEPAFKQEDGVCYHARDMAVLRAHLGEVPALLVSATPSLETLENVRLGRYSALHLPERHGGAAPPAIACVDLRRERPEPLVGLGPGWLSPPLRTAMAETLDAGEQVLLYLNRRGYAPLTLCRACGHRLQCPNCTAWLVEHRLSGRLQCHHCGLALKRPEHCPECAAEESLIACGPGVERLMEEVAALYPEARRAVLSSDTLRGPHAAEAFLSAFQNREIDLLIGTQIVAKGHHFPHLTLVGVVDADLGLTGGDLRAAERTYQLLHQVAGRAGRAERPGRVLLQTYEPEHPVIEALVAGDRDRFMAVEAREREAAGMPPFSRLVAVILSDSDAQRLDRVCAELQRALPRRAGIEVMGPSVAPLAVLRGRHRRRFLVRAERDLLPQGFVAQWLARVKLPNATRLQVDVDPYSFL